MEKSETYKSLLYMKDVDIYIYDNSPVSTDDWCNYPGHIEYVHDPLNSGLSIAYNKAAEYAKRHNFKWLMLLDQDTSFPAGAMDLYFKAIEDYPQVQMYAPKHKIPDGRYISPTKYFLKTSYPVRKVKEGLISFNQACPINSGIMLSVVSFLNVGGYDEEVTLDFSDIRFIEKYKKYYRNFCCVNVVCLQNYSVNEKNFDKLMSRYKIFLKCAKSCKREKLGDAFGYFFTTFKRTIRLTVNTRKMAFLNTYYQEYLLG